MNKRTELAVFITRVLLDAGVNFRCATVTAYTIADNILAIKAEVKRLEDEACKA